MQESASEGLVWLLDMIEYHPDNGSTNRHSNEEKLRQAEAQLNSTATSLVASEKPRSHPITKLFRNWYSVEYYCKQCNDIVSIQEDTGISLNMFFYDSWPRPITDPMTFADAIGFMAHLQIKDTNVRDANKLPRADSGDIH